jgi:N-acetylmuramoyl-L-alanine amidase
MPIRHFVQQGDCLSRIARRHGVKDWRTVWQAPENAELRRKRKNPNILFPGDIVSVPGSGVDGKDLACGSGHVHRFVANLATRRVKLTLLDEAGGPLAKAAYRLAVGRTVFEGTTSQAGVLEHDVDAEAMEALLHLGPVVRRLAIGHLNPVRDTDDGGVSGVQARLANLGYSPGRVDGVLGPRTAAAIREFQEAHGLEPTGTIDEVFLDRIERTHGC